MTKKVKYDNIQPEELIRIVVPSILTIEKWDTFYSRLVVSLADPYRIGMLIDALERLTLCLKLGISKIGEVKDEV